VISTLSTKENNTELQNQSSKRQLGIEVPAASDQEHILLIRLNLTLAAQDSNIVRDGLKKLCNLLQRIMTGEKTIDIINNDGILERTNLVKRFNFSSTIGFGSGFFEKLNVPELKRPKNLSIMPDHRGLGDPSPYNLTQTDLIIQIGSDKDQINRWVLENLLQRDNNELQPSNEPEAEKLAPDIVSAIQGWAVVTDIHAGFQRQDGRNLMGFNDGVSNPKPCTSLFSNVVWISENDKDILNGTYLVFQKIEHDLDQWRQLSLDEQEEWVGRKKITGLLKGTLTEEEENELASKLQSPNSQDHDKAAAELKKLLEPQRDPTTSFYDNSKFRDNVAAWSHVRKANPRGEFEMKDDKSYTGSERIIFRRGYLFVENESSGKVHSGLLFISFQKNIKETFEYIKKNFLNNLNFPVPEKRIFTPNEQKNRRLEGRYSESDLRTMKQKDPNFNFLSLIGIENDNDFADAMEEAQKMDTQNTGREGLAGPSESGVNPSGEFLAIVPFGGGYYFVPPILSTFTNIAEQFFEQ
jgi:Dyp-type peroxidase family